MQSCEKNNNIIGQNVIRILTSLTSPRNIGYQIVTIVLVSSFVLT